MNQSNRSMRIRLGSAWSDALISVVRHATRRWMFDRHERFWADQAGVSAAGVLAGRIVSIVDETPDVKTFEVRPNSHWRGHRAGQFTMLSGEADGVTLRRCYSISSSPTDSTIAITVKRIPGGRISNVLHDTLVVGQQVGLEQAAGQFILPEVVPKKLLFIAGGSGITPIFAMLKSLSARAVPVDATLVCYARSREDTIFYKSLRALEQSLEGFRFLPRFDDDVERAAGYDAAELGTLVSDFRERDVFLCGPAGLMSAVHETWARLGLSERVRAEAFVVQPPATPSAEGSDVAITLGDVNRRVVVSTATSLLEGLEAAGERPAHGCRMGICRSCRCRKLSGVVKNTLTGVVSDAPNEEIALCISAPRSDIALDL